MTFLLLTLALSVPVGEDLQCLAPDGAAGPGAGIFYADLQRQAYAALERRRATYEQLETPEQIAGYQQSRRSFFLEQLGGFPERTPLNPQVVGSLSGDGYRAEKVIFESQPQHHVTATLYLPAGAAPSPGVIVSSGHSRTGKAADYNQRFGILLARHGIAALCYDPIGQGERSQILTAEGQPRFPSTTQEHTIMGLGATLVGSNTARYRIWDAMRAIDYLVSRPDIDPKRIGMTGCSGGGTLTSYVMALDERVACAAPACYLTTFQRLIETIGPQDAEQNIFGQIAFGLDQPDYVLMRAPRPTLISATSGDFFDIQGTWDNFRQAKRLYARMGFSERVDLVEVEGDHGVQPENLTAIVRWMRRWLLGKDEPIAAETIPVRPESELLCTPRGQVLFLPGERSAFDLNAEWEARLRERRHAFWQKTPKAEAIQAVREWLGVRPLKQMPPPKEVQKGRVQRTSYHIDKLVLETDSGVPLPALTYHPPQPSDEAYLYLHEDGKLAQGAPGGEIEKLVDEGYVVVAVDLRGIGETAAGQPGPLCDGKAYNLAYLMGRSLVALHTEDALAAGHFVAYYKTAKPRRVHLVGVGRAAVPALHAMALEPELFTSLTLRRSLDSWSSLIAEREPSPWSTTAIHGALRLYDLPDLVRTLDPAVVHVESPTVAGQ